MSAEENHLDLNNLPDDFTRDSKQVYGEGSSSGTRRKKSGSKDEKDECGKVYECRFCSLKFCKSQALGGHMNRHRQERETETLYRARQLVFKNDNLAAQAAADFGYRPAGHAADSPLYTSMYSTTPPRAMFPGGSSSSSLLPPPPPPPPYAYPLPLPGPHDYYLGHALGGTTRPSESQTHQHYYHSHDHHHYPPMPHGPSVGSGNYTCIGAPVLGQHLGSSRATERDVDASHRRLDSSPINQFQDPGF